MGHRLTAADTRALAFGLKSRYVEAFDRLPEPDAPEYADRLLALIRAVRPDVLMPLGGLAAVSARLEEFERETSVLAAAADAHEALRDKSKVYALCEQLKIAYPRVLGTDPETLRADWPEADGDLPRVVLKPRQDKGAGRGLVFLHDPEGLTELWQKLTEQHGQLVATEFIAGPVDGQYAVQLLFDRDSDLVEFFVLRKLRQWPRGSGITVEATSSHELELVSQVLPLFRQLEWRGPVEVELKRDARTGRVCVLEINPRFSGTVAFPLSAGVDLAGSMLEASLGRSTPRPLRPYYAAGLHYWNPLPYFRSVLGDLSRMSRMAQGLRGLAMPLTEHPVGNPYVLSDPAALLGKVLWQAGDALRRGHTASEHRFEH
jgi:biotin carboxylase